MPEDINSYYRRENDKKLDGLILEVREIKRDVETLLRFRLMILAISSFVSGAVALLVEFLLRK